MSEKIIIEAALKIIRDNLGDYTANLYKDFYADKEVPTIIDSVSQLMEEIVGEQNSKIIIQELKLSI